MWINKYNLLNKYFNILFAAAYLNIS